MRHREHISVIPAGERWEDDSTRFALEDLVGAGAIVQNLSGSLSPEAVVAVATFDAAKTSLHQTLKASVSGKELSAKGYADDVLCASEIDSDEVAPVLHEGAYVDALSRHKKP
jgi:2-phosphosulfolactate phosphatase